MRKQLTVRNFNKIVEIENEGMGDESLGTGMAISIYCITSSAHSQAAKSLTGMIEHA